MQVSISFRIRSQKQYTNSNYGQRNDGQYLQEMISIVPPGCIGTPNTPAPRRKTDRLRLPSGLYDSCSPAIFINRLHIIPKSKCQTCEAQEPEHDTEWFCHAQLQARRLGFKMEGHDNRNTDDCHVYAKSKVREECWEVSAKPMKSQPRAGK
jgi:hypothetical protein